MEAFATVDDLQKRWKALSDIEKPRAETLLLDASAIISTMCAQSGITIDKTDELQALNLNSITCEMVKRAMLSPLDQAPMSNYSQTAGSYSESGTFVNPTGDLYLTSNEKKRLGIGRQRMFSIQPGGVANEG